MLSNRIVFWSTHFINSWWHQVFEKDILDARNAFIYFKINQILYFVLFSLVFLGISFSLHNHPSISNEYTFIMETPLNLVIYILYKPLQIFPKNCYGSHSNNNEIWHLKLQIAMLGLKSYFATQHRLFDCLISF